MFVQNFTKLSAVVHELSTYRANTEKTQTKTIQSIATVRTVITSSTALLG